LVYIFMFMELTGINNYDSLNPLSTTFDLNKYINR
jgi:hypothetical protein